MAKFIKFKKNIYVCFNKNNNMKTVFLLLFVLFLSFAKGQAHLGSTENAIRNTYPNKTWTANYADNGKRYISADMQYGNFVYYFDKETKLSDYCVQIPFNITTLNGQVEAYNKKYVITSDTSWTAYLEEGGMIYIKLIYNTELKTSYFTYSDTK